MITSPQNICHDIESGLTASGLYSTEDAAAENTWRISPQPFYLSPQETEFFETLGGHLLKFYRAINRLYLDSAKGKQPSWIAGYLDAGKPTDLIDLGRMNRFKGKIPGIIRPDVIVQEDGYKVTELDSVPGGFGVTTRLMSLYTDQVHALSGQENGGIPEQFAAMIDDVAGKENAVAAVMVSDEAKDYLREMQYLGSVLREQGRSVYVVHPSDLKFKDGEGLFLQDGEGEVKIDVLYRFYELFDLKNVPQADLIAYAVKKGWVKVTAPYKAYLEEKLNFALFHHSVLKTWWENALGNETFTLLGRRAGNAFAAQRARHLYASDILTILRPTDDDEREAIDLFEKFSDQRVSFTDCISFVLMRKKKINNVFSFDRDFERAGFWLWNK